MEFVFLLLVIFCLILLLWVLSEMAFHLFVPIERWPAAPFVPTAGRHYKTIIDALELSPGQTLIDLGCGHAGLLVAAAKRGISGLGYERSWGPFLLAKINVFVRRSPVKIIKGDLFAADLASADAVFCYLLPSVLADLEQKFSQELPSGSQVVTFAWPLPSREPTQVIEATRIGEKIYLYRY
ncbi:MAG: class I SAM-dependent methyltransferase [Candidatus Vogelbacteria bacterium]|nr:class I SAM-dependent methyltransferase [Candidatus Vogelbacteria bacterium]